MSIRDTRSAPSGAGHDQRPDSVQGVPLTDIAERFGTPVCVYDAEELGNQWHAWRAAHPEPLETAYVLAANPNVSVSATVRNWCSGAVVNSHTELTSALLSGYDADAIVLDGPLGSTALVDAALHAGIGAFAVTDASQAILLDDAASGARRPAAVVARVDPTRQRAAEDFLHTLVNHPFDRVHVVGVCLPSGPVTSEAVDLIGRLLARLQDVPSGDRLTVLQPSGSQDSAPIAQLTTLGRVVVATGSPQLGRASTVLARVVQTGRDGVSSVTLDCPLPAGTRPYALLAHSDLDGPDEIWTVAEHSVGAELRGVTVVAPLLRMGDLVVAAGVGLLDLPLPIGQILSHGVPAEVLVVDGRAVSIRSAATTEYLLNRQNVMSSAS